MLRDVKTKLQLARLLGLDRWADVECLLHVGAYRPIRIMHKGARRRVWEPNDSLKDVQRLLADLVGAEYPVPWTVHGYVSGRSAVTNAQHHVHKQYVMNFDLENFFASIDRQRLITVLTGHRYGISLGVAAAIADIACFKGVLPAGAPSSPVLSNVVLLDLDMELDALCFLQDCTYSRLSDDMTISTDRSSFPEIFAHADGGRVTIGVKLQRAVEREGLRINHAKTRLAGRSQRQMVTGLVVNDGVNVPRRYIRKLRRQLYEWKVLGLAQAASRFEQIHPIEGDYRKVLLGRIQYVGHVRGWYDYLYRKLKNSFDRLQKREIRRTGAVGGFAL